MSVTETMTMILTEALQPTSLVVENQSDRHVGHAGHDGSGESHFHLTIVAEAFSGLSRLERHRVVNDLLAELLKSKIHALSISALSPEENTPRS
jgi:BolA protein